MGATLEGHFSQQVFLRHQVYELNGLDGQRQGYSAVIHQNFLAWRQDLVFEFLFKH